MNVKLVCVGRLKEPYLQAAVAEYSRRFQAYGQLQIAEVKETAFKEPLSAAEKDLVMAKEAAAIRAQIPPRSFVTACDRRGQAITSLGWARQLQKQMNRGTSGFVYLIGGSLGLHSSLLSASDWVLSFSALTFPHQLMRVLVVEQLYRAATILRGEKYHK